MNYQQVFAALQKHVHSQSEPELLLLKGHLILEQCLNELLRVYIADTDALDKLNLTFSRKLDLLGALGHHRYSPGANGDAQIRELNRIRNKLAHRLDFEDYQSDFKRWACSVVGHTPKSMNRRTTYLNTVRRAFVLLAAFLSGVAEAKHDLSE